MDAGTRIVLVRHGESLAQELGIVGGHEGCRGLSRRGRRQVEALRDRWAATGELGEVAALYASVLPRAVETAAILAPALGRSPGDVVEDCGLCEHHPGEGDGLSWAEFQERYPLPEDGWSPDLRRDPGGETWHEMSERVRAAFDRLAVAHRGETVVVACHGGVIIKTMLRLLGLGDGRDGERAWLGCANASITEWCRSPSRYEAGRTMWELARYNDRAHLAGLDLPVTEAPSTPPPT